MPLRKWTLDLVNPAASATALRNPMPNQFRQIAENCLLKRVNSALAQSPCQAENT
jgi:hypothetical protein